VCDVCGKLCRTERLLQRHRVTHFPQLRRFECALCGACFYGRGFIESHMRVHDFCAVAWTCEMCGGAFKGKQALQRHQRAIHQRDKSDYVACPVCGKLLPGKYHVQRHMRTHTGEKPFACELCDWRFAQTSQLRTHKIGKHGVMPHTCRVCLTGCKSKAALNKHREQFH